MTRTRSPLKPALSMNHLEDNSGGKIVDTILGVPAFIGSAEDVVSTLSGRKAFQRVIDGLCEIMRKASPEIGTPVPTNGVISEIGTVVASEAGMSVEEANEMRIFINGYVETACHMVAAYAQANGLPIVYENRASGSFMVVDGALMPLPERGETPSRPGLSKGEMDAALSRWADALATLASVVNADTKVTEALAGDTAADQDEAAE